MSTENKNRTPYNPTTPMPGALYPVGEFPLVKDTDVAVGESTGRLVDYIPIILTQAEYNKLEEEGAVTIVYETPEGTKEQTIEYDEEKIYLIKRGRPIEPQ